MFAAALLARFPHLPVEEEGRLADPRRRENFLERVFAYRKLRDLFESSWTAADLVRFHAAHKLVLLAHSARASARLDRLVAGAKPIDREFVRARYTAGFMEALAVLTRRSVTRIMADDLATQPPSLASWPMRAPTASPPRPDLPNQPT